MTWFAYAKRSPIDGVSDELNLIASEKLDQATARRRVRSAFVDLQLKLDHCLFKKAPAGISTEEWYERNLKGEEVFCKSWLPEDGVDIKAAVYFCHGYGSTCTFFFDGVAKQLAGSGYGVYAIDHPGFGLSDGLHGHIPSFDDLVENAIEQFSKMKGRTELRKVPSFLFGQSMGGAIALKMHLKEPQAWDGLILVAPMCKFTEDVKPPKLVLNALILMSTIFPKTKLFPKKDIRPLFYREPSKRKLSYFDVICYDDQTRLKTAVELLNAANDIEMQINKVSSPMLILHGDADIVTDPTVSKFLYEQATSQDKTLKLYPGGYHCLLEGDTDENIFTAINDIVAWLDAHTTPK
ncbi:alpha/beta-Hydrolases superfamily protein [Raphanus sativus]|uniref:Caffeoylshikimate esterase-like n=1 Tax=Raphanus sativus TaxID=3726 RepID=A0A6J0K9U1_RAPSA|nr:caffeoylshikimate esterase-like [Raphanus sativus]KAJ4884659.1 alpha/beta-Hydrolases superfamily protein [Raphanus sativus]